MQFVEGTITAVNDRTGELETRAVLFQVEEDSNWIDVVDQAFEESFFQGTWILDDENLIEREPRN